MTSSGHWDFGDELELTDEQRVTLHERVHAGPEFRALRRRMRVFAFPMTAAFLLWYLAFVLLASYARDLMATPVLGVINLGLVIGLGQFATTFALTAAYVRYARHRLDPLAAQIRATVEDGPGRAAPAPTAAPANPVAAVLTPGEPARVVSVDLGADVASAGTRVGSAR